MANSEYNLSVVNGSTLTLSLSGPTGPAGPAGPTGPTGPAGPEGPVGDGDSLLPLAGGAMDTDAIITLDVTPDINDFSTDSEVGGWGFGVQQKEDGVNTGLYAYVEPNGFHAETITTNSAHLSGDSLTFDNGSKLKKGTTDAGLGGNGGIALKCSVDYELKWDAGRLYTMEQDGFTIRRVDRCRNIAPTAFDDSTKGFVVGSLWVLDDSTAYACTDGSADAAVWVEQATQSSTGGNGAADAGKLVEFNAEGGVAFEAIIANSTISTSGTDASITTTGVRAGISTSGSNANIFTSGSNATISTEGDNASISTSGAYGSIYTAGTYAAISTAGDNASIATSGANAYISTGGETASIFTVGINAEISTQGANAHIYTYGANAHIYTEGDNAHIYTLGSDANITTSGANATISTSGEFARIYTDGDNGSISTNGVYASFHTNGINAHIYTHGDNATIYTNGYDATIHTNGQDGHIFTNGTSATIYTAGDGAPIYTTGSTSTIYTNGYLAHISTTGSDAYIQTRATFNLFNGSNTTTLSHSPTANRSIAFPNASGTVALTNPSSGTQTFTGAQIFNSTTRPTSSATTATFAAAPASSLITKGDGDSRYGALYNGVSIPQVSSTDTTPIKVASVVLPIGVYQIDSLVASVHGTVALCTIGLRSSHNIRITAYENYGNDNTAHVSNPIASDTFTASPKSAGSGVTFSRRVTGIVEIITAGTELSIEYSQATTDATASLTRKRAYIIATKLS